MIPFRRMPSLALVSALLLPLAARAQPRLPRPPITYEGRIDGRISSHSAAEIGVSVIVPAGIYMRTAFTAAIGLSDADSAAGSVGRLEIIPRFLLDPFRESRYGLSIGGGIGITNSEGLLTVPRNPSIEEPKVRWRPYLAVVLDLETKKTAGWTPAVQIGLGGGIRLGVAIRASTNYWR